MRKKMFLILSVLSFMGAAFSDDIAAAAKEPESLTLIRREERLYLINRFSSTLDLVTELLVGRNGQLEFGNSRKIPGGRSMTLDIATEGTVVYYAADEGSPLLTNYGYVGANHGALTALTLTVPQHGFSDADIGKTQLKAGNRIYYILQIPDRDTLLVMSEDIGRGGIGFFDRGAMRKDFSAKGKTFAVEKILHTQLRPNVRIKKQEYRLDGAPLPKEDFAERGTVLVCDEVYEVVSPAALLRFVLRNPGRKVDLTDPAIDAALEITNRYTFTPDGTTHLRQKVKFMERISLRQWGLLHTQSIYTPGDNPFREYFIPKTVPFVQDGVAYDFAKGFRVLKPLPVVRITPDRIADPANPPDRFIQIAGCGTPDAGRVRETGLVIGYSLTGGATLPSIRKNSAAPMPVWINYTQKSYPCIISSVGGVAVEAGKELEASGYRKIFDPGRFGKAAQASYTVNDGGRKLLYLLFTEAGEAAIPPGFHKVVEKSAGLTISGNRAIAAAPGDYAVME